MYFRIKKPNMFPEFGQPDHVKEQLILGRGTEENFSKNLFKPKGRVENKSKMSLTRAWLKMVLINSLVGPKQ